MLSALVHANAASLGARIALECGDERLSYDEFADRTARLASGLASLGVERGDCVVVLLPNVPEYAIGFAAIAAVGAAAVLLDPGSKEHELRLAFADCRPRVVITDHKGAGRCQVVAEQLGLPARVVTVGAPPSGAVPIDVLMETNHHEALPDSLSDSPLLFQYSSGSTGRPKRVGRTQAQCVAEARLLTETLELSPDDTILCAVPLFHAYGLGNCLLAALGSGAKLVIQPQPQPFAVKRGRTLELVASRRVTVFPAVPYMAELLSTAPGPGDLSSIRYCFSAGTALPVSVAELFQERHGVPVRQLYGCTEAPSVAANLDRDPSRSAATVGRPMKGVEVAVHDEEGSALSHGSVGEIAIRSPVAASGYVAEEQGDRRTFRDGWVYPGDLGTLDEEGRLTIAGRTKVFIDVHGHKVDPMEVEDVLGLHPAVEEAVVVGTIDEKQEAEIVKAAVVASAPCSERELIYFCKERLAMFKVPQVVEFRKSIPRSPLGKVLRKELV